MPKAKKCSVNVGNIGEVVSDVSHTKALQKFKEYVRLSKQGTGRSGGEEVTLFCDGELEKDYIPEDMENNYD